MFLRSTYNYAIGYANIQVEGYFVERFINLCMNRNIEVWDINKLYDGVITLKIKNSDLKDVLYQLSLNSDDIGGSYKTVLDQLDNSQGTLSNSKQAFDLIYNSLKDMNVPLDELDEML